MAGSERPSPFTIPQPTFKFAEGPPSEPRPFRSMTVGRLIHNLTVFADFYDRASAAIESAESVRKPWYIANRDANADVMQRDFRATVAIDHVRAYVLAKLGAALTIGTARRLLGDLLNKSGQGIDAAEGMPLETARDRLESAKSRRGDDCVFDPHGARPGEEAAPKRSTERGEGRAKLIAALTKHHQYADGGCLKLDPIGNNELAKAAGVSTSTASAFLKDKFQGHTKYKVICRDASKLAASLKLLNGEFAPHILLGAGPAELIQPEQADADSE